MLQLQVALYFTMHCKLIALQFNALHCVTHPCTAMHCHCTVSHRIALHCTASYCTAAGLTKMVSRLGKEGSWRKALEIYQSLPQTGVCPDTAITNAAISACDKGAPCPSQSKISCMSFCLSCRWHTLAMPPHTKFPGDCSALWIIW